MSDYVVPLTSPVQLTNLNDIHAVDLHVRYCELVKAYEQLVRDRNEDKKDYEYKIRAMRTVMSKETVWKKREIEPKFGASSVPGSDVELRFAQLQKRLQLMEASLEDERKVNKELEADLQTAVKEGIKYRDHLALMLDIREKDTKAQENIRSKHDQDEARQNATLEASLKEAEKSVEFERAEAQRLQKELNTLEACMGANREENSSLSVQVKTLESEAVTAREEYANLSAQVEALQGRIDELESHTASLEHQGSGQKLVAQRLQDEIDQLRQNLLNASQQAHDDAAEELIQLQTQIEEHSLARKSAEEENASRVQDLECQIEHLKAQIQQQEQRMMTGATQIEKEWQQKVDKLEAEVEMLNAEIRLFKTNEQRLQTRIRELEVVLDSEKLANANLSKELKAKDDAHRREIEEMRDQLDIQSHNESTHQKDMDDMKKTRERHLAEIEKMQEDLQRERESKAKEVKDLQTELKEVTAARDQEVTALKDRAREFSKLEAQLRAEIEELLAELERRNSTYQKSKGDAEEAHLRELQNLQDEMEARRKETRALRREMEEALAEKDNEKDSLVRGSREKDRKLDLLVSEIEALKQKSNDLAEREARSRQEIRQMQDEVERHQEAASKATRDLQKERETFGREIRDLQDQQEQRQAQEQKLRNEVDDLQRARQRLLDQVEELQLARKKDKEASADASREQERTCVKQAGELQSLKSRLMDQTKLEQLLREELAVIKKAKDDLQARNEHQDSEIHDLQERISKARNPSDNPQTPHADKSVSGFATPSGIDNSLVPETPEADPEEWKTAIAQYEAAAPHTIIDFVLVNVISIDTILRRHLTSVTRIDISYNYLRNSGVISLAYVFKSLVNLVHLDIGDNHVGDSGAAAIAEATSASKKLQTLALGGNRISDPGLTAISNSMAPSLSTLNFNFNCVADDGATSLANALRAGSASLTCLYLSGNSIGSAGIQELADAVSKHKGLKQIYLRGNPLDSNARSALEKVAQHHPSLVIFV